MAYYLAVERVPNSYEAINIKKTTKGKELFKNDTYECTLEEIDRFTTEYDSLAKMSYDLHNEKKTPWSNCSLAIVKVDGIAINIKQDILFSSSKKYLENPNLVIEYILKQYKDINLDFFKNLLLVLPEEYKTRVENLTMDLKKSIICNLLFDESIAKAVAKSLIYSLDDKGIAKENEINYEKLHNIASFIANYENSLKEEIEQSHKRVRRKNT